MSKPLIYAALGARGTGKSAWCKQMLDRVKPKRLAVWDLMQEHTLRVTTGNLGEAIRAMKSGTFAVAFRPSREDTLRVAQFDLWCRAVLAAGRAFCHVEELAFVTTPYRAPPGWREMVLLGRHPQHQLSIMGTSQRPAQVDKEFLGNADLIHCGRLVAKADAQRAGEVLGVDWRELMTLPDLAYIERPMSAVIPSRGTLKFSNARAKGQAPKGGHPKGEDLQAAQA